MYVIEQFLKTPFGHAISRALLRSVILAVLFVTAGAFLEGLIELARYQGSDIAARFPELLIIFRAVAILAWLEMSIMWLTIATSFKTNGDFIAEGDREKPIRSVGTEAIKVFKWALRLAVLLQLCGFLS